MKLFRFRGQKMDIGDILRRRRKFIGLTQVELADKAKISQSLISQIEQGVSDNVTIGNLRGMAKALNCAVIDLLPESDKKQKL
ncbi:helix-turn-helix domain-containing protein [Candidatus Methylomicrobium oryzae]|jgi:transcriptional regulator with XRE-family HTH domain|uniref:helix-turn-helix domain-containing protein n=1 Tax=Candidatus Methylomicrobium oryzae TaxID=2802053 RepID=UPI001F2975CE|nr:helix-turn-helix transcriptional regulator [Methylomicrobium sp. RS1]